MLTARLSERTPSAKFVSTGYINEYRLTYNKVSVDGSGKCDIEKTGSDSDLVHGVIFSISESDKSALDSAEGAGKGYEQGEVNVITSKGKTKAAVYIATKKEKLLLPYHWYKALVVCGAIEHKLPPKYIEWLRTIPSKEDLDIARRTKGEAIIFSS